MYNTDVAPKSDPSAQAGSAHKALDEIIQQKNMMRLEIEQLRVQVRERDDLIESLTQHTHNTVNS